MLNSSGILIISLALISEFEELEAVPTLAVMDGPLEPTSSTAANATDASDDPSFVNFFSVRLLYLSKFPNFSESLSVTVTNVFPSVMYICM